jgi:hypothetical protein
MFWLITVFITRILVQFITVLVLTVLFLKVCLYICQLRIVLSDVPPKYIPCHGNIHWHLSPEPTRVLTPQPWYRVFDWEKSTYNFIIASFISSASGSSIGSWEQEHLLNYGSMNLILLCYTHPIQLLSLTKSLSIKFLIGFVRKISSWAHGTTDNTHIGK